MVAEYRSVQVGNRSEQPDGRPHERGDIAGVRRGPDRGAMRNREEPTPVRGQRLVPPQCHAGEPRASKTGRKVGRWHRPQRADVVFLESGKIKIDEPPAPLPGGDPFANQNDPANGGYIPRQLPQEDPEHVPIRHSDPPPDVPNGLELLLVWPTNWILPHFVVIGILFCFWKLPIFGLPRPEDASGSVGFWSTRRCRCRLAPADRRPQVCLVPCAALSTNRQEERVK